MRRSSRHAAVLCVVALTLVGCSGSSGPSGPPLEPTPTTLTAVEGQDLQALAGTVLPLGPTVEVLDQQGRPIEGAVVRFQVVEGGGTITAGALATTDSLGLASAIWILGGQTAQPQGVEASVASLSVMFRAHTIPAEPGHAYSGRESYIQYFAGGLPLVLSAPHGGSLQPAEIPDRTWGATVQDLNTRDLALRIRDVVFERTGAYPHLIVSNLHRRKLDPNRDIEEAAQGDRWAERAWWEYHTFTGRARDLVEEDPGQGFYVDLHGHGHEVQRLELGYVLGAAVLAGSDAELNEVANVEASSLRELAGRPGATLADLVRGPSSLGSLLEGRGFPSVPSRTQPDPGIAPYFTGGYSVGRYGSRDGGTVSGVQIECNYTGVRDTADDRQAFAEALVDALLTYFPAHFGMPLVEAATSEAVSRR